MLPAVSDRGPPELSDVEGDFVHAVGLVQSCYEFVTRGDYWKAAVNAYLARTDSTVSALSRRAGLPGGALALMLNGNRKVTRRVLVRLRAAICEDR